MNTNTAAEAATLTGGERAMALDLLDESPITRLTEDEPDVAFLNDLDEWDPEAEAMAAEWAEMRRWGW